MFHQILVPTDCSDASRHPLDIAVKIASLDGGNVYLLHVIEIIADTASREFEDFYLKLERKAETDMNGLLSPPQEAQVKIERKIVYGNRGREILRFAEDNKIDLIVMNSHRIEAGDPVQGWGTLSYKIGVLSQCPVMLVK
ncbi:MAG: universal stress protein [Deltaproteobacteria bacterium]|nr:universal stress protein [Deltaproteobacteria bacterium]